ncbi:hypothetical protein EVAR_95050_1 [Eumeta japonica]|uniref:Uncharacterized protein n=1 Tax=Eumeta variegata TaxID=151549 RepID=A0A4C1W5I0_EUMVA|nr:hypothetical protein EVAR_95050_1 [Eumeta japonica]
MATGRYAILGQQECRDRIQDGPSQLKAFSEARVVLFTLRSSTIHVLTPSSDRVLPDWCYQTVPLSPSLHTHDEFQLNRTYRLIASYPIHSQEAGSALMTPLELRVSLSADDHQR